jgi:23S rRNA (uridine2552-2'-O)-methyltransferase
MRRVSAYERKDPAYRRAKQEGMRSRAAYKLVELDRHFRIFRPGLRVVDLGCWPGAWTQVAARTVGTHGRVVGVDLVATDTLPESNVKLIVGDARDDAVRTQVREALGGAADVVLSDMAPKLSGVRAADSARHADLVETAIACAVAWLAPEGALLVKLFDDEEQGRLLERLRSSFRAVRVRRPASSRQGSAETYAYAVGVRS